MKKTILIGTLAVVIVAALGLAGFAYAQTPNPSTPQTPFGPGMGRGQMGRGGMGMWNQRGTGEFGPMHEYMEEALAEALGVKVEDLEAAYADGKTMWDFAVEQGLSVEEIQTVMLEAREVAINKMVADGVLSKEQGEWMLSRMQNKFGQGGVGGCPGMGGGYGRGGRWGSPSNPQTSNPPTNNY